MPIPLNAFSKRKAVSTDALQYLLHDPALVQTNGLFRTIDSQVVEAYPVALRLRHHHNEDLCLDIHAPHLLSGDELAVLQGLLRLAMIDGETISVPDEDAPGALPEVQGRLVAALRVVVPLAALPEGQRAQLPNRPLVGELTEPVAKPAPMGKEDEVQYLAFPVGDLVKAIGWPVNGHYRTIALRALRRLAAVTLVVTSKKRKNYCQIFRLLSTLTTAADSRKMSRVHIGLNPRLTEVLVGQDKAHTRLYFDEFMKLGADQVARILHQRLSAYVKDGTQREVLLSTLREYAFPNDAAAQTLAAVRKAKEPAFARRKPAEIEDDQNHQIEKALRHIEEKAGWAISLSVSKDALRHGEPKILVQRPKRGMTVDELAAIRHRAALRQARRRALQGEPSADAAATPQAD